MTVSFLVSGWLGRHAETIFNMFGKWQALEGECSRTEISDCCEAFFPQLGKPIRPRWRLMPHRRNAKGSRRTQIPHPPHTHTQLQLQPRIAVLSWWKKLEGHCVLCLYIQPHISRNDGKRNVIAEVLTCKQVVALGSVLKNNSEGVLYWCFSILSHFNLHYSLEVNGVLLLHYIYL